MSEWNIVAAAIVIVCALGVLALKVYQAKKKGETITFDTFLDTYGDDIITMLQDTIVIMTVDSANFESQEEYEKEIIHTTVEVMKKNCVHFGIPQKVVDLVDTDTLTKWISDIFNAHKPDAFSALDKETLEKNEDIIDSEVIDVLLPSYEEVTNESENLETEHEVANEGSEPLD